MPSCIFQSWEGGTGMTFLLWSLGNGTTLIIPSSAKGQDTCGNCFFFFLRMVPWISVHIWICLVSLVFHCQLGFLCRPSIFDLAVTRLSQFTVNLDFLYYTCLAQNPSEIFQELLEAFCSVFLSHHNVLRRMMAIGKQKSFFICGSSTDI